MQLHVDRPTPSAPCPSVPKCRRNSNVWRPRTRNWRPRVSSVVSIGLSAAADAMPKLVDHDQRREQIAQAVCQVVAKRGFDQATVARIARSVGFTTGMVAHYFKSKEEIFLAALRLILRRMEQRLLRAQPAGNDLLEVLSEALPIDRLRRDECAFWTAFWGKVPTDQSARRLNAWVHREYAGLFERCIAAHWPEWARWPTALRVRVLGSIMTFINGLTASAVTSPSDWPAARQLEQLDLQLRLLHDWAKNIRSRTEYAATRALAFG